LIQSLKYRLIRFNRCSKGVSTVIGTIFLVLIALTVATNIFLWSFTQNASYNQTVKELNQMDADQSSERVVAYNTVYSISQDEVEVNTTMAAQGPRSAQIITVWVTWTSGNDIKYGYATVNINVTSGEHITQTINVTVPGALPGEGVCNGWLVTARGNSVPLEQRKAEDITIAEVAEGIGSIAMNFTNFKYFEVVDGILQDYPVGNSAFELETGKDIVLAVHLTNFDRDYRTIVLSSRSLLWAYFPKAPGNPGKWPITAVNETTGAVVPYSDITLASMESKWIYFGPTAISANPKDSSGAVNLILLGTINGFDYGQNIPFVSIYVLP
jgi:FlaG/FlaF family flagellin (archaellin)